MVASIRPRRSALYMPASNSRALEKAKGLLADVLILDLEDAVAPEQKAEARDRAVAAAGQYGPREVLIRTNGLDTPYGFADIEAAARSAADGLLLPKVESGDAVVQAERLMDAAGAAPAMTIWCMIETPRGVLNAAEIAAASPRLAGFVLGTSDLAKDLNCAHTVDRTPMLTALSLCLLAARATGLAAIDGVYLDVNDLDGFTAACVQGRELGFDGKSLIHPKTIDAANAAFGPSDADLAEAEKTIAAFEAARREGKGVTLLEGRLVEELHVKSARRLIALSEAIEMLARAARSGAD